MHTPRPWTHTPRPWTIDDQDSVSDEEAMDWAIAMAPELNEKSKVDERLKRAMLDLLEACKMVQDDLPMNSKAFPVLLAAIAKAESFNDRHTPTP